MSKVFSVTRSILQLLAALAITGNNLQLVNLNELLHLSKLDVLEDKRPDIITKSICFQVAGLEK